MRIMIDELEEYQEDVEVPVRDAEGTHVHTKPTTAQQTEIDVGELEFKPVPIYETVKVTKTRKIGERPATEAELKLRTQRTDDTATKAALDLIDGAGGIANLDQAQKDELLVWSLQEKGRELNI